MLYEFQMAREGELIKKKTPVAFSSAAWTGSNRPQAKPGYQKQESNLILWTNNK